MSWKTFVTNLRDAQQSVFQLQSKINIFKAQNVISNRTLLSDFSSFSSRKGNIPSIKVLNVMQLGDVSCHVSGTATMNIPGFDDIPP